MEGKVYGWSAGRHAGLQRGVEPGLLGQAARSRSSTSRQRRDATAPSTASSARRPRRPRRRRQAGDRSPPHGPPRLRLARANGDAPVARLPGPGRRPGQGRLGRPADRRRSPSSAGSGALDAGRDRRHAGGRRPRRRRQARDRRRHQRGVRRRRGRRLQRRPGERRSANLLDQAQAGARRLQGRCGAPCDAIPDVPLSPPTRASTRSSPTATAHAGGDPFLRRAGRRSSASSTPSCCRSSARVSPGYPVIGPVDCGRTAAAARRSARWPTTAPAYVFNPDGKSCYGQDERRTTSRCRPTATRHQLDHPLVPAVGHPAFGDLDGTRAQLRRAGRRPRPGARRRASPSTSDRPGLHRRLERAPAAASCGPGFPQPVNDLQFLTGPSVADIDGAARRGDRRGQREQGPRRLHAPPGPPVNQRWPKLTTDWTVANPTIGSFGTLDTDVRRAQGRDRR